MAWWVKVAGTGEAPYTQERWRWRLQTRLLAGVDQIAAAPALREIGVSPKSLRQHSHIRLTEQQGLSALALLRGLGE